MTKNFLGFALAVGLTLSSAIPAHALTTWDFGGTGGVLGTTHVFTATDTVTPLTAAGFSFASGAALALHQDLKGLGIAGGCTTDISACGAIEFLRLEFGSAAWIPVSVTLERLFDNGVSTGDPWVVFADNDGNLFDGATRLASGNSTGSLNRQLSVLFPAVAPFQFLYLMPELGASGSDFRVAQVVGDLPAPVNKVPEPTTLWFGIGVLALGGVALRRHTG